jgi:hypothetical protein
LRLAGVILLPHVALEGFIDRNFQLLTLDGDLLGLGQPFVFLGLGCRGFLFLGSRRVVILGCVVIRYGIICLFVVILGLVIRLGRLILSVVRVLRLKALENFVFRHPLQRFDGGVFDFPIGIGHGEYSLG